MASIKSIQTLLSELRVFIRSWTRSLDTSENSLIKDLVLTPFTIAGKLVVDQLDVIRKLVVLSSTESSDLENEATNFGLERLPGAYAISTVTFHTTAIPTGALTIPADTEVQTNGTDLETPISYKTVSDLVIPVGDVASYYSYDRDRYEFPVSVLCTEIGTRGNVPNGYITNMVDSISGIQGATNSSAAYGGEDEESDDDLRERIRLKKTGRELNVENGLAAYCVSLGFLDSYPVRVEDAEAERATGVDAFVIDSSLQAKVDTFTYYPAVSKYYFSKRPILGVSSVTGSNIGNISATHYSVTRDTTSPVRRSYISNEYIEFDILAGLIPGETVTVNYTYTSLLEQTQPQFELPENKILTANVLLKRAYPLYLYLSATLTLLPNADGPTARNKVRNAISQWSSEFRLGDDLQKSDMVIVLQQGYGDYPVDTVDAVVISNYYLRDEFGTTYLPVDEIISVSKKQYVVYGSATIV